MTKLAIFGANGRMGRVLIDAIDQNAEASLVAASVREGSPFAGIDVGELAGIGKRGISVVTHQSRLVFNAAGRVKLTLTGVSDIKSR